MILIMSLCNSQFIKQEISLKKIYYEGKKVIFISFVIIEKMNNGSKIFHQLHVQCNYS